MLGQQTPDARANGGVPDLELEVDLPLSCASRQLGRPGELECNWTLEWRVDSCGVKVEYMLH